MKILDISHHQEAKIQIDWSKIKDFVLMKATQGNAYLDHEFSENKGEARKIGEYLGSYHFAGKGFLDGNNKLYYVAQDPKEEADWYLKNADFKNGEMLILDWEIQHSDPVAWCKTFRQRVIDKTGVEPWVYLNESTFLKYAWPLDWKYWIAKYGTNNGEMQTRPQGNWKIWQYTSRGSVKGIEGNVDLSFTELTIEELRGKQPEENPNIKIENQLDKKWAKWYLGKVKTSGFNLFGCHLFCWAYIYSVKMGRQILPSEVDKIFMDNGVYDGDMIISEKAAQVLGLDYFGREYNIEKAPDWSPTIKEVDFSIKGGKQQHFVVRINDGTGKYILDPYEGVKRKINFYESKVGAPNWETRNFSYRLVKIK